MFSPNMPLPPRHLTQPVAGPQYFPSGTPANTTYKRSPRVNLASLGDRVLYSEAEQEGCAQAWQSAHAQAQREACAWRSRESYRNNWRFSARKVESDALGALACEVRSRHKHGSASLALLCTERNVFWLWTRPREIPPARPGSAPAMSGNHGLSFLILCLAHFLDTRYFLRCWGHPGLCLEENDFQRVKTRCVLPTLTTPWIRQGI